MTLKTLLDLYLAFIKRFIPEPISRPVVGLDLGTHTCKLVELKTSSGGVELVNWAMVPVSGGDYKAAVRTALSKLTVPTTVISTAVYGKGTLVRYLDMPRMGAEELRRSFSFEVDKYFPFPKDQVYTDCHILNAKEKENRMLVLATAAKKDIVTQRMDLLKELGLEADFITINSMALVNAFGALSRAAASAPARSATALLDIGERVSTLVITVQGEPRFTRDIFLGGFDMTTSVSNALGMDFRSAENLKCAPQPRLEEVLHSCESVLLNLISEVRLSFDYFVTEKNISINEVILTGGGSLLEGLPEIFVKNLEIPAKRWALMEQIKLAPGVNAGELAKNINCFGVAVGLALSVN